MFLIVRGIENASWRVDCSMCWDGGEKVHVGEERVRVWVEMERGADAAFVPPCGTGCGKYSGREGGRSCRSRWAGKM